MHTLQGRSVGLHLWDESADGYKTLHADNWSAVGLCCPRNKVSEYMSIQEGEQEDPWNCPGVYFLVGPALEPGGGLGTGPAVPTVYVGEADNLRDRLKNHLGTREFWHTVYACTSPVFDKAKVKQFESRLVKVLQESKTVSLENTVVPSLPNLSKMAYLSAEAFLRDILIYLPLLGATWLRSTPLVLTVGKTKRAKSENIARPQELPETESKGKSLLTPPPSRPEAEKSLLTQSPPVETEKKEKPIMSLPPVHTADPKSRQATFFDGVWYPTRTSGETVGMLFDLLEKKHSGFLDKVATQLKTDKQQLVSRTRSELFKGKDINTDEIYFKNHSRAIGSGWWLNTNHSHERFFSLVKKAVALSGEEWGKTALIRLEPYPEQTI